VDWPVGAQAVVQRVRILDGFGAEELDRIVQDRRHFSRLTTGKHERQWAGAEFSGSQGLFGLVLSMLFWPGADARAELQMLERFVAPAFAKRG
jgi:hypothetical protein